MYDQVGESLEPVAVELAVETASGPAGVVERRRTRPRKRGRGGDPDEGAVERPAGERATDDIVLAGREQERQRRRPLAEVDAGDLAGLEPVARAVEDVVRDLEGDAEGESEAAERGVAAARPEQAGGLEQLGRLQLAAREIALDGRVGIVRLAPLQRLA